MEISRVAVAGELGAGGWREKEREREGEMERGGAEKERDGKRWKEMKGDERRKRELMMKGRQGGAKKVTYRRNVCHRPCNQEDTGRRMSSAD